MPVKLHHILRAPEFADPDRTRIARLLHIILLSTIVVNLVYSASLLLTLPDPWLNLVVDGALLVMQVYAFFLMRRGRVRTASVILVAAIWIYCNFVVAVFGGSQSPAIVLYLLVIIIAGLLLGGRSAVLLSALSVFAGLGMMIAEVTGQMPPSLITISPAYSWVALIMSMLVAAVLLYLAMDSLNKALNDARRSATALTEKNRQLEAMHGSLEERVRELKDAESALRQSQGRLHTVIDNAPVIIWGVDAQGTVTFLEGKPLQEIGIQPEQFVGASVFDIPDGRVPQMASQFRRALQGETFTNVEKMRGRIFEMRYAPLFDAAGEVDGIIGIAVDITERKQAEEALFQAQKLESLGVLAGGIAHDFNNLLVAMLGQTSLAERRLAPEHPAREHIRKAVDAAQKATTLTRQMLAYSGRGQLEIVPINMNTLIDENIKLFRASVPKTVHLEARLAPQLPPIEGDPAQMQQVIMNLILNAAEAIGQERGTVQVVTGVEDGDKTAGDKGWHSSGEVAPGGRYVIVEIRDDGCGMNEATLAKIFDPFFSTKATGQGLGLAAVLGIVHGHQGKIMVHSTPGKGTIFKLLFRASDKEATPVEAVEPDNTLPEQAGYVVLVVDDEAPVREAVTDVLSLEGIQVLTASNGHSALQIFSERSGEIDLVLLDLSMPGMSGDETLRRLREIDSTVPVILSSGYDKRDLRVRFSTRDLTGFIQKPYTAKRLSDSIWRYLAAFRH